MSVKVVGSSAVKKLYARRLPLNEIKNCSFSQAIRLAVSPLLTERLATTYRPPTIGDKPLSPLSKTLLPLLAAQQPHYATVHIHARPFLITKGDTVRLPFRIPGVHPGDILRLTNASTLGSRDYTLRGSPFVDENIFECRAVVSGLEAEPMRFKEKTMRRNRKVKIAKSKHRYTEIVICELSIKTDI